MRKDGGYLLEESRGLGNADPQDGGKLACSDEQGCTGHEGCHDRMGNEVCELAKARKAHAYLYEAAENGYHEDVGHAYLSGHVGHYDAAYAHCGKRGEQHHGDGVGGAGDKIARGAHEGSHDDRKDAGVDSVLGMHTGNECVGHGLGYGHGGDSESAHEIRSKVLYRVVAQNAKEGKEPVCLHDKKPPARSPGLVRP